MAYLQKPGEATQTEVKPQHGPTFSGMELCDLIDCTYFEKLDLDDGRMMWFDEEGKDADPPKPINEWATIQLARIGGIPGDSIVGNVLVTSEGEVD